LDIVQQAGLAENSDVRGCMVIKPHGYAIWENIQRAMDRMFKDTGHVNAYFPLFMPKSFLAREEEMAEGFAKECAVVTHYRLKAEKGKGLVVDPDARLEEELVIRPTSETIIWNTYKNWIQSYRDLPLLINQWCNVVRWEMRTRLFLRTAEFLWQEGHTAHATQQEARQGQREHAWATSWGVSTRLVGGLVMTHSDDQGLVVPPRLAPTHVVVCPLGKTDPERAAAVAAANKLADELRARPRDDFYG